MQRPGGVVMGATERDLLFYGWGPCGQAEHQCGAE
eukprot:COSAG01_NODE_16898_length_1195_cov_1.509124_2_plen_34_part_01